jgi:isochorismate synthase EntC
VCDPLDVFERGALISEDRFYWEQPDAQLAMAGIGSARVFSSNGCRPFRAIAEHWRDVCADLPRDASEPIPGTGPTLLGGFAFDPARPRTSLWEGFPDGQMMLPRYLVTTRGGASWLTISQAGVTDRDIERDLDVLLEHGAPAGPTKSCNAATVAETLFVEDVVPASEWQAMVASLSGRLGTDELRKVVLARACRVHSPSAWHPACILRSLRAAFPGCITFAVTRGPRCFLGATPERLVCLRDGALSTMGLAGSMGRGATPEEDRRLRDALSASVKDQTEHALVVRAIRDGLAAVCSEVVVAPAPTVVTLPNVHHLSTPIAGRVTPGRTVLDVVEQLHPTPGVG